MAKGRLLLGNQGLCETVPDGEPERLPEMEAYDLLPAALREVLREGPQEWGASRLLQSYQEFERKAPDVNAITEAFVESLKLANRQECRTGRTTRMLDALRQGIAADDWESLPPTPHMLASATMQSSHGSYENGERYKAMNRGNKRRD